MTFERQISFARVLERRATVCFSLFASALGSSACAAIDPLPPPRPLIVPTGVRVRTDEARIEEIDVWVRDQQDNIAADPSFWIIQKGVPTQNYPWEGLRISNDTTEVQVPMSAPDAGAIMSLYGHFHMMNVMERLEEFLPEGVGIEGYALEKAILARVSDAWLYGRAVFDMSPYGPLDELLYSTEYGYLDAFILTARPDEFEGERREWLEANPGKEDEYRGWFARTFERAPPGLRQGTP